MSDRPRRHALRGLLLALGLALLGAAPAAAGGPDWLEPRALNIADLAAQVPDQVLRGAIVANGASGIVVYESSSRSGDVLRIEATVYGRVSYPGWLGGQAVTDLGALGQMANYDNVGSVAPESWVRVYESGQDLTGRLEYLFVDSPALVQPLAGAGDYVRYPRSQVTPLEFAAEGLRIPANMGAGLEMRGDHAALRAVFTLRPRHRPGVRLVGVQEVSWQSYIGPGDIGYFAPLMAQLRGRYGLRHERIGLQVPPGANYVLFVYPPSPGDPYHPEPANRRRLVGGTMRLSPGEGMLSSDLMHSGPIPLQVAWQDADQSAGPYLSLLRNVSLATPPEVAVPAGVPFDPCFTQGNCSPEVLQRIYDAWMPMRIVYLAVEPPAGVFTYVPLRVADSQWTPALAHPPASAWAGQAQAAGAARIYLPIVRRYRVPGGCPCGAFEPGGRMVHYVP